MQSRQSLHIYTHITNITKQIVKENEMECIATWHDDIRQYDEYQQYYASNIIFTLKGISL